jgi:hypothetical protein
MSNRNYELLVRACVVAGVTSVLLYDRLPRFRWIALALGALAGISAVVSYFCSEISARRRETVASTSAVEGRGDPRFDLQGVEEKMVAPSATIGVSPRTIDAVWLFAAHHMAHRRISEGAGIRALYAANSWSLHWALREHPSRSHSSSIKAPLDFRNVVEEVVHVANRLDSDRFEVVLEPSGAIVVRPSRSTGHRFPAQQELGFIEVGDEEENRAIPN